MPWSRCCADCVIIEVTVVDGEILFWYAQYHALTCACTYNNDVHVSEIAFKKSVQAWHCSWSVLKHLPLA